MRKLILPSALLIALALLTLPALAAAPADASPAVAQEEPLFVGEDCNQRTCGKNQFCCNYSCSICAPLGGACTQQVCDPIELELDAPAAPADAEPAVDEAPVEDPLFGAEEKGLRFPVQCNQAVCGEGEFCCNYSCSTCAPIGGYCLDIYCPPVS